MEYRENIAGLAHIGIPTEDMEASRQFFETIGFTLLENFLQPNGRPVVFLGLGNVVLEVYEAKAAKAAGAIDHVALSVRDVGAVFHKMKELGYEALEGEIKLLDFGARRVRYFTISGPDKEKIEFCQSV